MHKSCLRGVARKIRANVRTFASDSVVVVGGPSNDAASSARSNRHLSRALVAAAVAAVASISLLVVGGLAALPASAAPTPAPNVSQCNPPDFPTGAGLQVTCSVTVENTTSSTGATSSTVTTSACLAAAGVVFPSCPLNLGPVTSTVTSTQLVLSVNECNGIVTGGGSNVYCTVNITNNVPAATPTSGVTVNQCNGSVTGGGGTIACNPTGSTTGATVNQCNNSVTGGGTYAGEPTAGCNVTGASSADPVTVNQCNYTAIGPGSAVTCSATFANVFAPADSTSTVQYFWHRWDNRNRREVPQPDSPGVAEVRLGPVVRPARGAGSRARPGPLLQSFQPVHRRPASVERPGPTSPAFLYVGAWPWSEPY